MDKRTPESVVASKLMADIDRFLLKSLPPNFDEQMSFAAINGIAAAPQNIGADVRGQVVLSCHQSYIGSDGGFAQLPVLLYRFCHGLMLLQWDR